MNDPKWINIYPLIPIANDSDVISQWVKIDEIKAIELTNNPDLDECSIYIYSCSNFMYKWIGEKAKALEIWENLKSALGIKVKKKMGPARRFYEEFENVTKSK